jgi:hypothetical protein
MPQNLSDGDSGFTGVNTRLDPGQLQAGNVANAINMRFERGVAAPRYGIRKMSWSNKRTETGGASSTISAAELTKISPFGGTIYGSGMFKDPNGEEWLLVATSTDIYRTRANNHAVALPDPESITLAADVVFVQCFHVMIMFRGADAVPLAMTNINEGFKSIVQVPSDTGLDENDSDGTENIPNSSNGIFFGNRLVVPYAGDLVAVSDYLNYTRFQPVLSTFRINQGSDDDLVALWKFDENTVLCFKERSIYAVRNLYGNYADAMLQEITRGYGLKAAKSLASVGRDVWFLSDQRGVCSLRVAESGRVQGVDVPVSDPVQSVIDRINWVYADVATAAYHQNRYYLAVPLDGATKNNAVIVYDFINQAWSGYDTSNQIGKAGSCNVAGYTAKQSCINAGGTWTEEIGIKDFVIMPYNGANRLMFLTTEGFINLYDDRHLSGFADEKSTSGAIAHEQINHEMTTRGYDCETSQYKRFRLGRVQINTWNPTMTATADYDGIGESEDVWSGSKTFDRTKYDRPFNAADYTTTTADQIATVTVTAGGSGYGAPPAVSFSGGGGEPGAAATAVLKDGAVVKVRVTNGGNDYTSNPTVAIVGDATATGVVVTTQTNGANDHATAFRQDYSVNPSSATEGVDIGAAGIDFDAHQKLTLKGNLHKHGRYAQLKISATTGRMEVTGTSVQAALAGNIASKRM